jgi:hypothetical protein
MERPYREVLCLEDVSFKVPSQAARLGHAVPKERTRWADLEVVGSRLLQSRLRDLEYGP